MTQSTPVDPAETIAQIHQIAKKYGYLKNRPSGGDHGDVRGLRYSAQYASAVISVKAGTDEYEFPARDVPDWDTIRDTLARPCGGRMAPVPPAGGVS